MDSTDLIYLDYQATTPVDPRVLEAMLPYFGERFGNAASVQHAAGRAAAAAVESAREQVAAAIGADRREIVFCSGATEADSLALKGLTKGSERDRLVVLATEHPAVMESARSLRRDGYEVVELNVDAEGQPSLSELREEVDERTLLVSVAAANNEIGTLPPLAEIARIAHEKGAYFHTDAAQAVGRVDLDVGRDGIDLLSLSGHKLYGPKGVGALYVRTELQPLMASQIEGGGHERGLRSGTLNVPGIVGLGAAAELAMASREEEAKRLRALAIRLLEKVREEVDGVELNGPQGDRLPGNLNLRFAGVDAEALIANCPGLAISAGSACSAATPTPSHVLTAIGLDGEAAEQSVRIGVGRPTAAPEVDRAADLLAAAVDRIREATSVPQGVGVR
ncbi:MAG TPA: cysteine desulfurase family protein [Solirubrobacterales bacterium]|jgi:cysteine desulfurase|nr:cysteine desulfurase family protein [Solirubrobacterales bacterium]